MIIIIFALFISIIVVRTGVLSFILHAGLNHMINSYEELCGIWKTINSEVWTFSMGMILMCASIEEIKSTIGLAQPLQAV